LDNHNQKISHLKALYHLACADNEITKAESIYIRIVAERLGVKQEELEKFDASEPVLELPEKQYELYGLFHRLAIIIMIDNNIDENERRYCFNLGIKMGLHPNAIDEIIDHIQRHGTMASLPKDIIAIFKKYLS